MITGRGFFAAILIGCIMGTAWLSGVRSESVDKTVQPPAQQEQQIYLDGVQERQFAEQPAAVTHYTAAHPASSHPVLQWTRVNGAVMYDVQILEKKQVIGADDAVEEEYYEPVMPVQRVYAPGCELALPPHFTGQVLYWRVRGMGLKGQPVSDFSVLEPCHVDIYAPPPGKPVTLSQYNDGYGHVLLYPVYDWLSVPGAASYEVEILDEEPENPNGITPSVHRIASFAPQYSQQYDDKPRFSDKPFYWRVRALNETGAPLGVYSDARSFVTNPAESYMAAVYGDSISHGGGSISYSPTDWEFSYAHYLNFPTINLAESGDTSAMTNERFERDVLPFHPKYLLILMGSNSLREGTPAADVIADMKAVQEKCRKNGIRPVLLTVPPVNPVSIENAWHQPTVWDWQHQIEQVNEYIRSQVHIDITPGLADENGFLKPELALDGLHLDPPGKAMMGAAVNAAWPVITALPETAWK